MADEAGFELGRAFVSVDPDAADFDEKLAEQIGSPVVMVRVVPDTADFDAKVDEETGGHAATIRVDADTSPAQEKIDQLPDRIPRDAKFTVDADTSPAEGGLSRLDAASDETRAKLDKIQEGAAAASRALGDVGGAGTEAAGELAPVGSEAQRAGEQFGEAAQGIRDFSEATGAVARDAAGAAGGLAGLDGALDAVPGSAAAAVGGLAAVKGELGTLAAELDGVEGAFGTAGSAMSDFSGAAGGVEQDTANLAGALAAPRDALRDVADNAGDASKALGGTGVAIGDLAGAAQPLSDVGDGAKDMADGAADAMTRFTELRGTVGLLEDELGKLDDAYGGDSDKVHTLKLDLQSLRGEMDAVSAFNFKGVDTEDALQDWTRDVSHLEGAVDDLTAKLPAAKEGLGELDKVMASGPVHNYAGMYDNVAQDIEDTGKSAEAAAPSVEKLGEQGIFAGGAFQAMNKAMGELLSSPVTWAVAAAVVIGGLGYVLTETMTGIQGVINKMGEADQATGYNMAGYQKLAHQMKLTDGIAGDMTHAIEGSVDGFQKARYGAESYDQAVGQVGNAEVKAQQEIRNLSGNLSELEGRYHGTQQQAYELIQATGGNEKAAKKLGDELAQGGHAAQLAMHQIEDYGDANVGARGKVGAMNYEMSVFGNDALTASQRVGGLDSAFNSLVGNFSNSQQAMLQVEQGFLTLGSNAKQSGASMTGTNEASVTLQQSFYQQIGMINQVAQAMVTQGDSTQQVTTYINDQISKLSTYTGSSQTAQQAVQGLKTWEDNLHDSTGQATQALQRASSTLQDQFIVQVKNAGYASSNTKGDVGNLATAIQNTGTQSNATADARAKLIAQLEKSGMSAKAAKADVDKLIGSLGKIPKQVASRIFVSGKGVWSVSESEGPSLGIPNPTGNPLGTKRAAAGMMVTGGTPGKDSVLISAMPGELVVPAGMVKAGAVDHLRGAIPGFASGGVVQAAHVGGAYGGGAPGAGWWADSEDAATNRAVIASVEQAMGAAINSKLAKAKAAAAAGPGGGRLHLSGSGASVEALMKSMAASIGWTGAQWQALYDVEMREAGFDLGATNPSSGAYGLAQFIQGASEYAQYGGNSGTARGQITGMLQYIKDRYGTPSAAWQHELNYGWYDQGGMLQPGATLAQNNTGQPEMILPPSVTQALTSSTGPIAQLTQSLNNPAGGVNALDKALVNPGGPLAYLQRTIANPGGPMVQLGKAVANPGGPMAKLGKTAADPGGPIAKLGKTASDPGGPIAKLGKAVTGATMPDLATALTDADGPMMSLAGALDSFVSAYPGQGGGGGGGGGGHKGSSHDDWTHRWGMGGGHKGSSHDRKSGGGHTLKGRHPAGGGSDWTHRWGIDPAGSHRSGVNPGGPDDPSSPHMTGTPVYNINVNYNGTKPSAEDHQAAMLKLSAAIGVA